MRRFDGYAVMITGAGRGVGAEIARCFAAEGAGVLIAERDQDRAEGIALEIAERGGTAMSYPCDVTERRSVRDAVSYAVTCFGRLDVLVNNAAHSSSAAFAEQTEEQWERDLDTTLLGAFRCAQETMPHLIASDRGAIVNIGSINAERYCGSYAYSAAKAGLASFTRSLAVTHARKGVRANLIAPGTIRTPHWESLDIDLDAVAASYPIGRLGRPADVAAACLFLASADASWITGVTLPVDGGLLASDIGLLRAFDVGL